MSYTLQTAAEPFISKYRPTNIADLVLPRKHCLKRALDFVSNPRPEAYLLYGPSGLGKTTLARIMALAAAGDRFAVRYLIGPDLDSNKVRDIALASGQPPLFGKYNVFVVDEADSIPVGGQVRLLGLLENLGPSVWILTSNESLDSFEARLVSRVKALHFSNQGILEPATDWLMSIAKKENIKLTRPTAQYLIRDSKSNLRAALQALEVMGANQVAGPHPRSRHLL